MQETAAQPGELDAGGRAKAQALARTMRWGSERRELFEAATEPAAPPVAVRLQEVRLKRGRSFVDELRTLDYHGLALARRSILLVSLRLPSGGPRWWRPARRLEQPENHAAGAVQLAEKEQ